MTWPLLLAWERANSEERARLENLIQNWQPEHFPFVNELLSKYETFEPSLQVVEKYLQQARTALNNLPKNNGSAGLFDLADFLAQQIEILAVCV